MMVTLLLCLGIEPSEKPTASAIRRGRLGTFSRGPSVFERAPILRTCLSHGSPIPFQKRGVERSRKHGNPVFRSLAIVDCDLVPREVDVLNPEAKVIRDYHVPFCNDKLLYRR
ncbi:MAG: hypothetical protein U0586_08625 [Candidatus Brocadiaceae bacterium]